MKLEYEIEDSREFYIWGNGKVLRRYLNQLPRQLKVKAIVDRDESKWGHTEFVIGDKEINCVSPQEIEEGEAVIIAIEDVRIVEEIKKTIEKRNANWCHIYEVVDKYVISNIHEEKKQNTYDSKKIVKFIDTIVPVYSCNLKCEYCYLAQNNVNLNCKESLYHDKKYIRYALSKDRLGGVALINFCGSGETLLSEQIIGIVKELVEEGHYIQIVTNATVTKKIDEFIASKIDMSHVFFKCSFHYRQLLQRKMLGVFEENIKKMKAAGASVTIEIVPEDDLVPYIDDIKEYCLDKFGALPHITVTRDERYEDFRVLSNYSREEYKRIWGSFESGLFEYKINHLDCQKGRNCMAGLWAGELNIASGELEKCISSQHLCNIYENIMEEKVHFESVGKNCQMPYCVNNHIYLTLGLIPEIKDSSYLEMRDRECNDGTHWITSEMREVFKQKLYENCEEE